MAKNSQIINVSLEDFYAEDRKNRVCCYCKETLVESSIGRPKIACSKQHYSWARSIAEKTVRILVCRVCENDIPATGKGGKRAEFCSESCRTEGNWRRNLYRVHHIRIERFNEILAAQNGVCSVCKWDFDGNKSNMNVDHDHSCCPGRFGCGKCVRGILCSGCNGGMGLFKDNPDNLDAAAQYLRSYNGER